MNEVMYEIPSDDTIAKCVITKDAVDGTAKPLISTAQKMLQCKN